MRKDGVPPNKFRNFFIVYYPPLRIYRDFAYRYSTSTGRKYVQNVKQATGSKKKKSVYSVRFSCFVFESINS
jgi:hypothetical protein